MSALCPICRRRKPVPDYKPFCSKRCADIDLGRWFNGGYGIPTDERPEEGGMPFDPDAPAND